MAIPAVDTFHLYFRCQFDYLDIYADLSSLDPEAQISSPLLGRFCGDRMDILPSRIISTTNVILISFHSDGHRSARGFYGSYRFIDACRYIYIDQISVYGHKICDKRLVPHLGLLYLESLQTCSYDNLCHTGG